jgi:hypothetical protein
MFVSFQGDSQQLTLLKPVRSPPRLQLHDNDRGKSQVPGPMPLQHIDGLERLHTGPTAHAFTRMQHRPLRFALRAVILKALLIHPSRWPQDAAEFITSQVGPWRPRQSVRRRDNVRRFLGLGPIDSDEAIACATDRATLWGAGELGPEVGNIVEVPVPGCFAGQAALMRSARH